jgi:hypothetical protein
MMEMVAATGRKGGGDDGHFGDDEKGVKKTRAMVATTQKRGGRR